jgi:hypothetical protein
MLLILYSKIPSKLRGTNKPRVPPVNVLLVEVLPVQVQPPVL